MNDKIMTWVFVTLFIIYHLLILTLSVMAGVKVGFLLGLKVFGCYHVMGLPVTGLSLYVLYLYIADKLGYIELDD